MNSQYKEQFYPLAACFEYWGENCLGDCCKPLQRTRVKGFMGLNYIFWVLHQAILKS